MSINPIEFDTVEDLIDALENDETLRYAVVKVLWIEGSQIKRTDKSRVIAHKTRGHHTYLTIAGKEYLVVETDMAKLKYVIKVK